MSPTLLCSCGDWFSAPVQATQDQGDGTALGFTTHEACNSTRCWEIHVACGAPIEGGCCTKCGVSFAHEPCEACGRRGLHWWSCPEADG